MVAGQCRKQVSEAAGESIVDLLSVFVTEVLSVEERTRARVWW